MEEAMTFNDIIKKSFLESTSFLQAVNLEAFLRAASSILLALCVGLILYFLYKKTYAGVVYSRSFATSLIGMSVLTCTIIVTISSNVVLSLGMVGALSIVRYRTAVKDPMDLLYMFWAVASGIAVGAGLFVYAFFALIVLALTIVVLKHLHNPRDEMYILLVHYVGTDVDQSIRRALGTRRYKIKSKTLRKHDAEMAIEVRVKTGGTSFVDGLRDIEGVSDVSLIQYSGDYID